MFKIVGNEQLLDLSGGNSSTTAVTYLIVTIDNVYHGPQWLGVPGCNSSQLYNRSLCY